MTKPEQLALFRLCIKAGIFELGDFREELERAEKVHSAMEAEVVPLGIRSFGTRIEEAQDKRKKFYENYLEFGEVPYSDLEETP